LAKFEIGNIQYSIINIQFSMKKVLLVAGCWLLVAGLSAQTITLKLQKAFQQFTNDSQLKHAISSLYVIDAKTGKVVFDKNSQVGLAGASTQKIITATTAFELLGKDYRYKTELGYKGKIAGDTLIGSLLLHASGDPTFGSWRYPGTKDTMIYNLILGSLKGLNIKNINYCNVEYNYKDFSLKIIPDGWIWQDIGSYYGAPAELVNWKENQYDITLRSGNKIGSKVEVLDPDSLFYSNELSAAAKNSGDNAYTYFGRGNEQALIAGTIPVNEPIFKISVANSSVLPGLFLEIKNFLNMNGMKVKNMMVDSRYYMERFLNPNEPVTNLFTYYSPSLDSIIYWFLKRSINLYGEAFIKTFAYEKKAFGSTDNGVDIVKDFWEEKGLDRTELNIWDGSGLSPLNRITTHAQVEVLKFAKTRDWFPYFYNALPEYNNMKMKSGTISGVKGFAGYQTSKSGNEYIFSFLVNNYNGSPSSLVDKMYKVLNDLK
jgi:D-alanyl-D-alanine carboxypeptidase/D-alanyl-D-alanine-endopeptidase (penicillin-binding protein 4)